MRVTLLVGHRAGSSPFEFEPEVLAAISDGSKEEFPEYWYGAVAAAKSSDDGITAWVEVGIEIDADDLMARLYPVIDDVPCGLVP